MRSKVSSEFGKQINGIVEKLKNHFHIVTVHPSANDATFCELRKCISAIPNDLLSFWHYCDGIQIADSIAGNIFGIQKALGCYPLYDDIKLSRFVPLREDGCGDYDCLLTGDGPCEGAVVFWDHEIPEGAAYLLGGSFLNYLNMWAEQMIHEYFPDGKRDPRCQHKKIDKWPWIDTPEYTHPWPFDEIWMREHDPFAKKFLGDDSSRRWLLRQDDLK